MTQKKTTQKKTKSKVESLVIKPPNFAQVAIPIIGIEPLVINRFGSRIRDKIRQTMEAGARAKNTTSNKEPRDFDADYRDATHVSEKGWCGMNAAGVRDAAISACRVAKFTMTKAKLSIFVLADGYCSDEQLPLVKIYGPPPENWVAAVRNANGKMDLRARPRWHQWGMILRMRYDADQFGSTDVYNLIMRVGLQVGFGAGRPDSTDSCGLGIGLFRLAEDMNEFKRLFKKESVLPQKKEVTA